MSTCNQCKYWQEHKTKTITTCYALPTPEYREGGWPVCIHFRSKAISLKTFRAEYAREDVTPA